MSRKLRKTTALAASLAFAGAGIFGTAASAGRYPGDPACEQQVIDMCSDNWLYMGYASYSHCVTHQICLQCPSPGQLCGASPYATDPDSATRPW